MMKRILDIIAVVAAAPLWLPVVAVAALVLVAVLLTSAKVEGVERKRVLSFIPMFVASAAFFSLRVCA